MKFLTGFFLLVFLFVQTPVAEANVAEDELKLQLEAIIEYIEQNFTTPTTPLSNSELREIINDGSIWIVNAQEESGHFAYEYEPYEGEYMRGDNMVRQAGAFFALSEVYKNKSEKDPEMANALEQAIEYFVSMTKQGDPDAGEYWCIKNSKNGIRCDLGTVSLALIGILNYVAAEPEKTSDYSDIINKYVAFIKGAKFEDRGFSDRYTLDEGYSDTESPFYNGEAMLALVNYYQYKPEEKVRTILEETFTYLSAQEEYETPLYLWIMAALKDMQRLWPNDAYVQYASEFTAWRLNTSARLHGITHNYCAPIEGFTSAYSVLEKSESRAYLERLSNEIDFWLNKTSYLQLNKKNPYKLVFIDGQPQLKKLPDPALAHGGFLTGENELTQRIDFTQHCVSSYLQKLVDIDRKEL